MLIPKNVITQLTRLTLGIFPIQQDNEAIRSEDQNDDSLFGTNGRLYKGLQGGDTNLINRASTSRVVLIISLTSLTCSVILSKMLSTVLQ